MLTRTVWLVRGWLTILTGLLTFLLVGARQTAHKDSERIDTVCRSFASVGNIDALPASTLTGISVIVVHRNAAVKLGCGSLLNEPSEILLQKVKKFNLQLDG